MPSRRALSSVVLVVAAAAASACASGRPGLARVSEGRRFFVAGGGEGFVDLYPHAVSTVDAMVRGRVGGVEVTVHYATAQLDEETARRFLQEVEGYWEALEHDYEIYRKGLRAYLGDELFRRIQDGWMVNPPTRETEWYLLAEEKPSVVWSGPAGSAYHFLSPGKEHYDAADLRPRRDLRYSVHSLTHWVIRNLLTSRRKMLPRWLEEGIGDYVAMQFERWRDHHFDAGREVLARLTWNRPAVQRRLPRWRNPRGIHFRGSTEDWEDDLLYKGSLGLVFAMESEIGAGELADLLKTITVASPPNDQATRRMLEERLGMPLEKAGRMTREARDALLATLLERARRACGEKAAEEFGAVPLKALGHFPEAADRVVPALRSLVRCPDEETAIAGLDGLRYLGQRGPLREALAEFTALHPGVRGDNRVALAKAVARTRGGWFSERAAALPVPTEGKDGATQPR